MYNYQSERPFLFTDEGQRKLLQVRDHVAILLKTAGAIRMQEAVSKCTGSSWESLACVDRLVELGEIVEIPLENCAGQHRVFIRS